MLIYACRPELLSTAGYRSGQLLYLAGVNGSRREWAVRRLVIGYLVPVVDRLLVRERATGSHPSTTNSDSDISVRGDVDFMA